MACRELGFEPLVRKAGGRAAAYHEGRSSSITWNPMRTRSPGPRAGFRCLANCSPGRCATPAWTPASARSRGSTAPASSACTAADPQVPERRIKLVGTAQRVVAGGWLFSSVIVVENSAPIRAVLEASYAALGLEWDPATAGAADDLVPGLDVDAVEAAVIAAYGRYAPLSYAEFSSLL